MVSLHFLLYNNVQTDTLNTAAGSKYVTIVVQRNSNDKTENFGLEDKASYIYVSAKNTAQTEFITYFFNVHGSVHRNNILAYKSQKDAHVTEFI